MKHCITPFKTKITNNNDEIFPHPVRCLIVGASGCGKTNLVWNIITKYWIPYKKLYVFTRSINQPIYEAMQKIFDKDLPIAEFFENCDDIILLDDCESDSLVIFDDCILEKQDVFKEYFIRGRHKNISCIYLTQCYTSVDRKVIRNNLNFLIIFKQNDHYIRMIWEDYVASDYDYETFKRLCRNVWTKKYGFLSIDLTKNIYRTMFDREINDV